MVWGIPNLLTRPRIRLPLEKDDQQAENYGSDELTDSDLEVSSENPVVLL